jgi:hypothetical protein
MRTHALFKGYSFERIGEDRVRIFQIVECDHCHCHCVKHTITIMERDDNALIFSGVKAYTGPELPEAHQPMAGGRIFCTKDFHLWLEGKIPMDDNDVDSLGCKTYPLASSSTPRALSRVSLLPAFLRREVETP